MSTKTTFEKLTPFALIAIGLAIVVATAATAFGQSYYGSMYGRGSYGSSGNGAVCAPGMYPVNNGNRAYVPRYNNSYGMNGMNGMYGNRGMMYPRNYNNSYSTPSYSSPNYSNRGYSSGMMGGGSNYGGGMMGGRYGY